MSDEYRGVEKLSQRESSYSTKELVNQLLKDIQQGVIQGADGSPSLVVRDDSYLSSGKLFAFSKIFYDFRKTKFFMLKKMH